MKVDSKKTQTPDGSEPKKPLGAGVFLGIVLLAGALFNIPQIMKVPQNGQDWLFLVIVLAMAAVGAILLLGRRDK